MSSVYSSSSRTTQQSTAATARAQPVRRVRASAAASATATGGGGNPTASVEDGSAPRSSTFGSRHITTQQQHQQHHHHAHSSHRLLHRGGGGGGGHSHHYHHATSYANGARGGGGGRTILDVLKDATLRKIKEQHSRPLSVAWEQSERHGARLAASTVRLATSPWSPSPFYTSAEYYAAASEPCNTLFIGIVNNYSILNFEDEGVVDEEGGGGGGGFDDDAEIYNHLIGDATCEGDDYYFDNNTSGNYEYASNYNGYGNGNTFNYARGAANVNTNNNNYIGVGGRSPPMRQEDRLEIVTKIGVGGGGAPVMPAAGIQAMNTVLGGGYSVPSSSQQWSGGGGGNTMQHSTNNYYTGLLVSGVNGAYPTWEQLAAMPPHLPRIQVVPIGQPLQLNWGLDIDDPLSKVMCWRLPRTLAETQERCADRLDDALRLQYAKISPFIARENVRCLMAADVGDLKETFASLRRAAVASKGRVLFHYMGFGLPTPQNNIMWMAGKTSVYPLPVEDLLQIVGFPSIFIFDCNSAGNVLLACRDAFRRAVEAQQRFKNPSKYPSASSYAASSAAGGGNGTNTNGAKDNSSVGAEKSAMSMLGLDDLMPATPITSNIPMFATTGGGNGNGGGGGGGNAAGDSAGNGTGSNLGNNNNRSGANQHNSSGSNNNGGGASDQPFIAPSAYSNNVYVNMSNGMSLRLLGASASSSTTSSPAAGGSNASAASFAFAAAENQPITTYADADNRKDFYFFGACGIGEQLPIHSLLPSDLFTSCLTTPLKAAVQWFVVQNRSYLDLHPLLVHLISAISEDKNGPIQELTKVFTAVTDCLAWSLLPPLDFSRLMRRDCVLTSTVRGYLLADRIFAGLGVNTVSFPFIPHSHINSPLWESWDGAVSTVIGAIQKTFTIPPTIGVGAMSTRNGLFGTTVAVSSSSAAPTKATPTSGGTQTQTQQQQQTPSFYSGGISGRGRRGRGGVGFGREYRMPMSELRTFLDERIAMNHPDIKGFKHVDLIFVQPAVPTLMRGPPSLGGGGGGFTSNKGFADDLSARNMNDRGGASGGGGGGAGAAKAGGKQQQQQGPFDVATITTLMAASSTAAGGAGGGRLKALYPTIPFFRNELTSFHAWLDHLEANPNERPHIDRLPILFHTFLLLPYRGESLHLLCRLADRGMWAIAQLLPFQLFAFGPNRYIMKEKDAMASQTAVTVVRTIGGGGGGGGGSSHTSSNALVGGGNANANASESAASTAASSAATAAALMSLAIKELILFLYAKSLQLDASLAVGPSATAMATIAIGVLKQALPPSSSSSSTAAPFSEAANTNENARNNNASHTNNKSVEVGVPIRSTTSPLSAPLLPASSASAPLATPTTTTVSIYTSGVLGMYSQPFAQKLLAVSTLLAMIKHNYDYFGAAARVTPENNNTSGTPKTRSGAAADPNNKDKGIASNNPFASSAAAKSAAAIRALCRKEKILEECTLLLPTASIALESAELYPTGETLLFLIEGLCALISALIPTCAPYRERQDKDCERMTEVLLLLRAEAMAGAEGEAEVEAEGTEGGENKKKEKRAKGAAAHTALVESFSIERLEAYLSTYKGRRRLNEDTRDFEEEEDASEKDDEGDDQGAKSGGANATDDGVVGREETNAASTASNPLIVSADTNRNDDEANNDANTVSILSDDSATAAVMNMGGAGSRDAFGRSAVSDEGGSSSAALLQGGGGEGVGQGTSIVDGGDEADDGEDDNDESDRYPLVDFDAIEVEFEPDDGDLLRMITAAIKPLLLYTPSRVRFAAWSTLLVLVSCEAVCDPFIVRSVTGWAADHLPREGSAEVRCVLIGILFRCYNTMKKSAFSLPSDEVMAHLAPGLVAPGGGAASSANNNGGVTVNANGQQRQNGKGTTATNVSSSVRDSTTNINETSFYNYNYVDPTTTTTLDRMASVVSNTNINMAGYSGYGGGTSSSRQFSRSSAVNQKASSSNHFYLNQQHFGSPVVGSVAATTNAMRRGGLLSSAASSYIPHPSQHQHSQHQPQRPPSSSSHAFVPCNSSAAMTMNNNSSSSSTTAMAATTTTTTSTAAAPIVSSSATAPIATTVGGGGDGGGGVSSSLVGSVAAAFRALEVKAGYHGDTTNTTTLATSTQLNASQQQQQNSVSSASNTNIVTLQQPQSYASSNSQTPTPATTPLPPQAHGGDADSTTTATGDAAGGAGDYVDNNGVGCSSSSFAVGGGGNANASPTAPTARECVLGILYALATASVSHCSLTRAHATKALFELSFITPNLPSMVKEKCKRMNVAAATAMGVMGLARTNAGNNTNNAANSVAGKTASSFMGGASRKEGGGGGFFSFFSSKKTNPTAGGNNNGGAGSGSAIGVGILSGDLLVPLSAQQDASVLLTDMELGQVEALMLGDLREVKLFVIVDPLNTGYEDDADEAEEGRGEGEDGLGAEADVPLLGINSGNGALAGGGGTSKSAHHHVHTALVSNSTLPPTPPSAGTSAVGTNRNPTNTTATKTSATSRIGGLFGRNKANHSSSSSNPTPPLEIVATANAGNTPTATTNTNASNAPPNALTATPPPQSPKTRKVLKKVPTSIREAFITIHSLIRASLEFLTCLPASPYASYVAAAVNGLSSPTSPLPASPHFSNDRAFTFANMHQFSGGFPLQSTTVGGGGGGSNPNDAVWGALGNANTNGPNNSLQQQSTAALMPLAAVPSHLLSSVNDAEEQIALLRAMDVFVTRMSIAIERTLVSVLGPVALLTAGGGGGGGGGGPDVLAIAPPPPTVSSSATNAAAATSSSAAPTAALTTVAAAGSATNNRRPALTAIVASSAVSNTNTSATNGLKQQQARSISASSAFNFKRKPLPAVLCEHRPSSLTLGGVRTMTFIPHNYSLVSVLGDNSIAVYSLLAAGSQPHHHHNHQHQHNNTTIAATNTSHLGSGYSALTIADRERAGASPPPPPSSSSSSYLVGNNGQLARYVLRCAFSVPSVAASPSYLFNDNSALLTINNNSYASMQQHGGGGAASAGANNNASSANNRSSVNIGSYFSSNANNNTTTQSASFFGGNNNAAAGGGGGGSYASASASSPLPPSIQYSPRRVLFGGSVAEDISAVHVIDPTHTPSLLVVGSRGGATILKDFEDPLRLRRVSTFNAAGTTCGGGLSVGSSSSSVAAAAAMPMTRSAYHPKRSTLFVASACSASVAVWDLWEEVQIYAKPLAVAVRNAGGGGAGGEWLTSSSSNQQVGGGGQNYTSSVMPDCIATHSHLTSLSSNSFGGGMGGGGGGVDASLLQHFGFGLGAPTNSSVGSDVLYCVGMPGGVAHIYDLRCSSYVLALEVPANNNTINNGSPSFASSSAAVAAGNVNGRAGSASSAGGTSATASLLSQYFSGSAERELRFLDLQFSSVADSFVGAAMNNGGWCCWDMRLARSQGGMGAGSSFYSQQYQQQHYSPAAAFGLERPYYSPSSPSSQFRNLLPFIRSNMLPASVLASPTTLTAAAAKEAKERELLMGGLTSSACLHPFFYQSMAVLWGTTQRGRLEIARQHLPININAKDFGHFSSGTSFGSGGIGAASSASSVSKITSNYPVIASCWHPYAMLGAMSDLCRTMVVEVPSPLDGSEGSAGGAVGGGLSSASLFGPVVTDLYA